LILRPNGPIHTRFFFCEHLSHTINEYLSGVTAYLPRVTCPSSEPGQTEFADQLFATLSLAIFCSLTTIRHHPNGVVDTALLLRMPLGRVGFLVDTTVLRLLSVVNRS
jgi:hypothetical protein